MVGGWRRRRGVLEARADTDGEDEDEDEDDEDAVGEAVIETPGMKLSDRSHYNVSIHSLFQEGLSIYSCSFAFLPLATPRGPTARAASKAGARSSR